MATAITLTVSAPPTQVPPNGSAVISINLTVGTSAPADIVFTLSVPTSDIVSVTGTIGSAAAAAGKQLTVGTLTPTGSGTSTAVCVIFGFNQTLIEAGPLALLTLTIAGAPANTTEFISLIDASAADANANAIPVITIPSNLSVLTAPVTVGTFLINFVTPNNVMNATALIGIQESFQFTVGSQTAAGGASILGSACIGEIGIGFDECVFESSGVVAISFNDVTKIDASHENVTSGQIEYVLPGNVANATTFPSDFVITYSFANSFNGTFPASASTGFGGTPCADGENSIVIGQEVPATCFTTFTMLEGGANFAACFLVFTTLLGGERIPRCAAEWNGCQLAKIVPPTPPPVTPPPVIPPPPVNPVFPGQPSTFGHGFQCEIFFIKAPGDILDFTESWSSWLIGNDQIVAAEWAADPGITIVSSSFTTVKTTVTLSGGTAGTIYALRGSIATAAGRIELRSALVFVEVCTPNPAMPPSTAALQCFRLAPKNPLSVIDIQLSWGSYLVANDTITNSIWTVPAGLTQGSTNFTASAASIRIGGGVSGTIYTLVNVIQTGFGQIGVRRVEVQVGVCTPTTSVALEN